MPAFEQSAPPEQLPHDGTCQMYARSRLDLVLGMKIPNTIIQNFDIDLEALGGDFTSGIGDDFECRYAIG